MTHTARLFEWYVKKVWPVQRLFVKSNVAKRCRVCCLSERSQPLDAEGVCSLCLAQPTPIPVSVSQNEPDQLHEILHKHQGAGAGLYDALVLFSGGKDSTYMIARVQEEHPQLRLLAFSYDNTFMSPVALANISFLIGRLGIDHVMFRPCREFMKTLFRYTLTHLNKNGAYGTVDFSDGEFLLDQARRIATEKNIPLILCGYSRDQVQLGLGFRSFESPRDHELKDRTEVAGIPLDVIFSGADRDRWWRASQFDSRHVARLLFPLSAWNRPEETIQREVNRQGLIRPRYSSPIVTNHQLIPLLGVVDIHRQGYSSFEAEFSRMVRDGRAQKEQWQNVFEFLEYCARTGFLVRGAVEASLRQLDLTLSDVGIRFGDRRGLL